MREITFSSIVIMTLLLMISCSGGSDAIAPSTENPDSITGLMSQSGKSRTFLWGYYDVFIDIGSGMVEAVENRGAMFTANVVNFINSNPAGLGFKINSTQPGSNWVDVDIDVSITHPFPGMPHYNGYDVRGVFMGDGSKALQYNSDLIYSSFGTDQFMFADPSDGNGAPDGYTRWFNKPEFSMGGMLLFQYTQGSFATQGFN
ncbi:MAG TPA: hypothetical protein ENN67_07185, partial [Firmicutes bacterium]|nr:hypothetical protein [Bacillota bacterium]